MSRSVVRIGALNVERGGYPAYQKDLFGTPPRAEQIRRAIEDMNLDVFVGSDVQGWKDPEARSLCLPPHLQEHCTFVPLNDKWLEEHEPRYMRHLGVVIATNRPGETEALDLCGRQAVSYTMNLGEAGLRIIGAYLNHASEAIRTQQIDAIVKILRGDKVPTIVIGDLNAQEALREVTRTERIRSHLIKAAGLGLSLIGHPHGPRLLGLEERTALAQLNAVGAVNVARHLGASRSTALNPGWLFTVDHAYLHGLPPDGARDFRVHNPQGASDHRGISLTLAI